MYSFKLVAFDLYNFQECDLIVVILLVCKILVIRSEGPSQVFLIVLVWMLTALQGLSREERRQKALCYDNKCHLNNLKVAKKPLPLPGHLSQLWFDVKKIIDSLHISNHKDQACKEMYSPAKIKEDHPNFNTMCCEQTFAWLSR